MWYWYVLYVTSKIVRGVAVPDKMGRIESELGFLTEISACQNLDARMGQIPPNIPALPKDAAVVDFGVVFENKKET